MINNPTNKNEVFDFVLKNIIKQGGPSLDIFTWECMYRGSNGRKCAVGILIPDEDFDPNFEGLKPWIDMTHIETPIPENRLILINYLKSKNYDLKFLRDLQLIHDECSDIDDFNFHYANKMIEYAKNHNIIYDNSYEIYQNSIYEKIFLIH